MAELIGGLILVFAVVWLLWLSAGSVVSGGTPKSFAGFAALGIILALAFWGGVIWVVLSILAHFHIHLLGT